MTIFDKDLFYLQQARKKVVDRPDDQTSNPRIEASHDTSFRSGEAPGTEEAR